MEQPKPKPSRPEAIRRLVELGLKVKTPARPVSKPGRRLRAQELAAKAIEEIIVSIPLRRPKNAPSADVASPRGRRNFARTASICRNGKADPASDGREKMSKRPKIDQDYRAGKDNLKITIHGYSL
jgi:hypothetical protein